MSESNFEWDEVKNLENQEKHGVSFYEAQHAFLDPNRLIAEDLAHSQEENRYFCIGRDESGEGILTPVHLSVKSYPRLWSGLLAKGQKGL